MADTGWTRPTRAALITAASEDMRTSLAGVAPYIPRSVLWVVARVIAGAQDLVYGALEYASRQIFAAEADDAGVLAHANEFGLVRVAAVAASDGTLAFTGTPAVSIPSGTEVVRSDGIYYTVTTTTPIGGGGSVSIAASCQTVGATSNAADGDGTTYQLGASIAGVDTVVTVDASFTGGSDLETVEELRIRVLQRKQDPPQGGAEADYVAWALEYIAAAAVWVVANRLGAGTVGVYFALDGSGSAIIPGAGDVAAVQALIDGTDADGNDTRRPVTAAATAIAPIETLVVFTLAISPDNTPNRAAIQASLDQLALRKAGQDWSLLVDIVPSINETALTSLTVTAPPADVTVTTGRCATRGTITWV